MIELVHVAGLGPRCHVPRFFLLGVCIGSPAVSVVCQTDVRGVDDRLLGVWCPLDAGAIRGDCVA